MTSRRSIGGVKVNKATTANFTDVIDTASSFWGAYMQ